jgi:hypothetical protein
LAGHNYGNPAVKSLYLSRDELVKIRKKAIREFYFRPRYVIRMLLGIRSPRELISYIEKGFALLFELTRPDRSHERYEEPSERYE